MRISRKVRITEALLFGSLFFLSGCTYPSKPRLSADAQAEALSHFSLGFLAEAEGDPVAALEHLEAAIRIDPGNEKLYTPAVSIALELKRPEDALRLANGLLKQHPNEAAPQLLLARVYALTDKLDRSETLFRRILADFPDNPDAPVFLARFYLAQDQRNNALKTLRSTLSLQSENTELLYLTGTLCIDRARSLGDVSAAKDTIREGIGFLQQALALEPREPLRWQQLGLALLALKQPDEALHAFQEARLYDPSDMAPARQVFDLLIQTGKYDEAMTVYDQLAEDTVTAPELWLQYLAEKMPKEETSRLIEHLENHLRDHPQSAVYYYTQLGSLYIGAHKNEEAENVLQKALEDYPDDNRLHTILGYLYLQQSRYDDAYTELDKVRTRSPEAEWSDNPFFLYHFLVAAQKSEHMEETAQTLALTYTNSPAVLNRYLASLLADQTPLSIENTIDLLNAFHTLSPTAVEPLYYRMVLQAEQRDYSKALETARQLEKLAKNTVQTNLISGAFYYQYASLYERTGQLESAEKLFFKAIATGEEPVVAASQNYVAYMWAERGEKLDSGLELIHKALAADPKNGAFLDTLGWIYYQQGHYADALKELQKAYAIIQNDPDVLIHLGDTCLKLGNSEEASKYWKKALELDPESNELNMRLKENGFTPDEVLAPANSPANMPPRP
jgi:tetratricopeptide (TPR) repeat protein